MMNPPNIPETMSAEGKAQYAIFLECVAAERAGTATLEQRRFVCRIFNAAIASLGGTWATITNEDFAEGEAALEWEAAELRRMCSAAPTHAVHTTEPRV